MNGNSACEKMLNMFLTKKIWIKIIVKCIYISIGITKIKKCITPTFNEQEDELGNSCNVDGNI